MSSNSILPDPQLFVTVSGDFDSWKSYLVADFHDFQYEIYQILVFLSTEYF